MKLPHRLHGKTIFLIGLMAIFGSLGDVLLRKGMKQIGAVSNWRPDALLATFERTFRSGSIWLGISSLLLFFIAYLLVLSWADYSYVQPASATGYLFVAVLGYLLLGEVVPWMRWIGVLVICIGVLLVGGTPPRTTEEG
ncbi:MAG: EamA family transporter [Candidatus Acidiferrales bacterium]|jgi:drug/metabolite transporter (DMT)-like permease|nr:EamA family transporter [Candidatus Acidoferrales bacterium]